MVRVDDEETRRKAFVIPIDRQGCGLKLTVTDGTLDIADAMALLVFLFTGNTREVPCEGEINQEGNLALLDVNGSQELGVDDAIYLLNYLFRDGPEPVLGDRCLRLTGCSDVCRF